MKYVLLAEKLYLLGKTYKVLKRAGVTVFYDENGNTLFDVTNDRLQEEYERAYGRKEDITAQDEQLPGQIEIHDYPGICPDQDTSIDELDLSVRTYNCLKRAGIDTIEQLNGMSDEELVKIRNFGKYNMDEVHKKLTEYDAEMEECVMPHNEEIVIENDDSVIETDEIVVEDADSVVEELTEETTEDSDIQIVKKTLERENRMLRDMRECYTEADWRVRRQKLLVGALANFMCELEDILNQEEEQEQPELPVLKNMEQREEFVLGYKSWPVWSENKLTEETYYRYNLPDDSAIVVREYPYIPNWRNEECTGKELFLLRDTTKHFKDGETNMTTLKEHLKNVQKRK